MPSGWQPWRFAPWDGYAWPGADPADVFTSYTAIPAVIVTTPVDTLSGIFAPFWGIKRGDVDHDCEDCGSSLVGGSSGDSRSSLPLVNVSVDDRSLQGGEEADLSFYTVEPLPGLRHYGLELLFDGDKVEITDMQPGELYEVSPVFGWVEEEGHLSARYSWASDSGGDADGLAEGGILFSVRIRAKTAIPSLSQVLMQPDEIKRNWVNTAEGKKRFQLAILPADSDGVFARIAGPNPASGQSEVSVTLPAPAEVIITLIDGEGNRMYEQRHTLPAAASTLSLPQLPQRAGVYTVLVQTPRGCRPLKLAVH